MLQTCLKIQKQNLVASGGQWCYMGTPYQAHIGYKADVTVSINMRAADSDHNKERGREAYVCSSVSSFSKSDRDSVRKSWGQRYGAKATSGVRRPRRSPLCRDDNASISACAVAQAFLLLPLLLRARLASYPRTHTDPRQPRSKHLPRLLLRSSLLPKQSRNSADIVPGDPTESVAGFLASHPFPEVTEPCLQAQKCQG